MESFLIVQWGYDVITLRIMNVYGRSWGINLREGYTFMGKQLTVI